MQQDSRESSHAEWQSLPMRDKLVSILCQFIAYERKDQYNKLSQDKTSFMLKTR